MGDRGRGVGGEVGRAGLGILDFGVGIGDWGGLLTPDTSILNFEF
jgi:hypothetical protein